MDVPIQREWTYQFSVEWTYQFSVDKWPISQGCAQAKSRSACAVRLR